MIRIQNIYYMLAYAFSLLRGEKIEELCDSEEFKNTADLLAAILENGVNKLIKRGLNKSYIEEKESLSCLRGKQMYKLYEKFILEYYRKEYLTLNVSAAQIPWWLDEESDSLLPMMQSDITIKQDDKVLIIDAKYYGHTTVTRFEKRTLISANLYQIFTYVKNYDTNRSGNVSGLLLYAQPDNDIEVNSSYMMSGNKIAVKTLNLDLPFKEISEQLDEIIINAFSSGLKNQ